MKTRIITLILTTFTLLSLTSCLSGIDTSSNNGGNGGNGNNQDQTSDYYKLEVNGSTWQIHKSKAVIKENTGENQMDYTVTLIAVDASNTITLDSKQLYRKVKQLTGYSPVNYIRKLRMNKASLLLMEGKFTVAEVMYMVGYSNSSYFSKCFTEEFGLKPKDYALKNRNPMK